MIDSFIKNDYVKCNGCSSCSASCPVGCISMEKNDEGFLYPHIDMEKCIKCNKCERACPVLNKKAVESKVEIKSYAVINNERDERVNSSSGGVFTLLAKEIISRGGVVFGAAFDENMAVYHRFIEKEEDIALLRGSKYTQSRIGDSYKKAEEFLKEGRLVLFTGTPCQIAGLKSYLSRDYENLFCQDIICHGVPSPSVWEAYVEYRERKSGEKPQSISFRNKKYGWKTFSMRFQYENAKDYTEMMSVDLYMRLFSANLSLRESCYNCSFKSVERDSDISLADFWGIENVAPEVHDDMGTSLVIVQSEKGKEIFEKIKEKTTCKEVDTQKAVSFNSAMTESVPRPEKRDEFFNHFIKNGINKDTEKFVPLDLLRKFKRKLLAEKHRKELSR